MSRAGDSHERTLTRRDLLASLFRRPGRNSATSAHTPVSPPSVAASTVAHIVPRHCLAWRNLVCTTCVERCAVEGAIEVREGRPFVRPDRCTGCGDCRDVCPAPINAVMSLPRPAAAARH